MSYTQLTVSERHRLYLSLRAIDNQSTIDKPIQQPNAIAQTTDASSIFPTRTSQKACSATLVASTKQRSEF
jgi:hypothetical protein